MIALRPAGERGHANHGWLDSWHSFSFGDYRDPAHVHWGPLRVINEDRVAAGQGFGTHGHRDMEIISYVLQGALGHKDSMGNAASIVPGEVQRLSAGTGITHSEYNYDASGTTHFLQIWIIPRVMGVAPSYAQRSFSAEEKRGRLRLVVSGDGAEGSVSIHQDARMHAGLFDGDETATLALAPGRLGYVHLVRGELEVNGHALRAGDALKLRDEPEVRIRAGRDAEVLVFDLPPLD
ncbi:pirin family protein [Arenimonas sp.]|uniref:pirin family protein n=1 Tax=Arenimonas sp. TaxID=1872635 RepID=UPI002E30E36D|nr:pirin family protein [Arenimonas sp.]HEX4854232.1 pirin family protein [Arenimonas sp.]